MKKRTSTYIVGVLILQLLLLLLLMALDSADDRRLRDNLKVTELRDSIVLYQDSMKYYQQQYDSLLTRATLDAFRIEQTKYYLDICRRKPDQKVFLYGWVKRAVE